MQCPLTHRNSPSGHCETNSALTCTKLELEYLYSASESLVIIISLLSLKLAKLKTNKHCAHYENSTIKLIKKYEHDITETFWNRHCNARSITLNFILIIIIEDVVKCFIFSVIAFAFVDTFGGAVQCDRRQFCFNNRFIFWRF